MLSLGPGSSCDVCLEPFDHGTHTPHSIRCGHVFCIGCLCHLTPCVCPLCRKHFDEQSIVKLHLDLDNVLPAQHVPGPVTVTAEQEARRLHEAITNVANQGASEQHLRQLIDDCRTFLAAQPRPAFQDLRVSHRMLAYMCDIRSKLKAEKQVVEGLHKQIADLSEEKKELTEQYDALVASSAAEKEAAVEVEITLRDHYQRAEMAYQYMADRYKFVVSEWGRLNEELKILRAGSQASDTDYKPAVFERCNVPDFPPVPPPSFDLKMKEAMLQSNAHYLISPLPEFTGGLPSSLDGFSALPEVDEDLEKKIKESQAMSDDFLDPIVSSCGEPDCPLSCQCVPFPLAPQAAQVASAQPPEDPVSRGITPSTAHLGVLEPPESEPPSPAIMPSTVPGGLSLTIPRQLQSLDRRPLRSQSFSSRPSSRSRSRPPSLEPTRPASPKRSSSFRSADSYSFSAREIPGREAEQRMRSRLHDILQDSTVSSSLPNMPSAHHFMSARLDSTRDADISRTPSRSTSTTSSSSSSNRPLPPPPRSTNPPTSASSSVMPGPPARINSIVSPVPSACTTTHTPATASASTTTTQPKAISHASSAALALEKAQRAEKERQKSERERHREERRGDADRRADKERDWSDRLRVDTERVRSQVSSSSTASPLTSSHSSTTLRDSPHREIPHRDNSHRDNHYDFPSTSLVSGSGSLRRDGSVHQRVAPASLRDSTIQASPHPQYSLTRSSGRKLAATMTDNRVGLFA